MDYRLLLETAVLAGEIMLKSGAETYRVEDTVSRILGICPLDHVETLVMSTSIIAAISDPSMDGITLVRRIKDRDTYLNRIYMVNNVSRRLCDGKIDLETANTELKSIKNIRQYNVWFVSFCIIIVTALFPFLLSGGYKEAIAGIATGIVLSGAVYLGDKIAIDPFVTNIVGSLMVTIMSVLLSRVSGNWFSSDIVIISSIMSLLPGVAITNAVRDTLQGDFVSGGARVLEAFVKAAGIVLGVGAGLALCGIS